MRNEKNSETMLGYLGVRQCNIQIAHLERATTLFFSAMDRRLSRIIGTTADSGDVAELSNIKLKNPPLWISPYHTYIPAAIQEGTESAARLNVQQLIELLFKTRAESPPVVKPAYLGIDRPYLDFGLGRLRKDIQTDTGFKLYRT
jgi:hypothetical protein